MFSNVYVEEHLRFVKILEHLKDSGEYSFTARTELNRESAGSVYIVAEAGTALVALEYPSEERWWIRPDFLKAGLVVALLEWVLDQSFDGQGTLVRTLVREI